MDKILLFPYWIILKIRHLMFDLGIRKVRSADVPTICVGNITVGGTGKTPHTEMLIRTLLGDSVWKDSNISVLSRGYKRKSKGFQQVMANGSARDFGDEPLQIKNKFPYLTVAVDKSRTRGCDFLAHPDKLQTSKKARRCKNKDLPASDLIILDDAFQHRSLKPTLSIVLVDFNRPTFNDHLLPMGRLRDLPERIAAADVIIVSKCPHDLNGWQKSGWAEALGVEGYDQIACSGIRDGKHIQHLFFTSVDYDTPLPIFEEGDNRYLYAKRLILFSGIADDSPLRHYLSTDYRLVRHFSFPDHHAFTHADISEIKGAAEDFPTAVIMTTEKDSQRVRDCRKISDDLKQRMFYVPIKTTFLSDGDREVFVSLLNSLRK
ncbi:MAG: tetraacyldisaccharide 4'-kinase [Candidatus Cryptobacteroides sp.]